MAAERAPHLLRPVTPEDPSRPQRVYLAGASLNQIIQHPSVTPFERLWRRLPEQGIHSSLVSPERPFTLEMGSFQVPQEMTLFIFDYRPDVYRFSGQDPNDILPAEDRRFSGQMGWNISINGTIPGNIQYELQPIPRQTLPSAYIKRILSPGEFLPETAFNITRANQFGAAAGSALGTLPQRHQRYGAQDVPFTLCVYENQIFQANAKVFEPILTPIGAFEFDVGGYLLNKTVADKILRDLHQ